MDVVGCKTSVPSHRDRAESVKVKHVPEDPAPLFYFSPVFRVVEELIWLAESLSISIFVFLRQLAILDRAGERTDKRPRFSCVSIADLYALVPT